MKKRLIACILIVLALLIAVGIFLTVRFLRLYREQNATEPPAALTVSEYASAYLSAYDAQYTDGTLTLTKQTALTYEDACRHGADIYEGDLAPETYLPQVRSILADVASKCDVSGLTVVLQYESSDGEVIFTVCSDGTVQTCWG